MPGPPKKRKADGNSAAETELVIEDGTIKYRWVGPILRIVRNPSTTSSANGSYARVEYAKNTGEICTVDLPVEEEGLRLTLLQQFFPGVVSLAFDINPTKSRILKRNPKNPNMLMEPRIGWKGKIFKVALSETAAPPEPQPVPPREVSTRGAMNEFGDFMLHSRACNNPNGPGLQENGTIIWCLTIVDKTRAIAPAHCLPSRLKVRGYVWAYPSRPGATGRIQLLLKSLNKSADYAIFVPFESGRTFPHYPANIAASPISSGWEYALFGFPSTHKGQSQHLAVIGGTLECRIGAHYHGVPGARHGYSGGGVFMRHSGAVLGICLRGPDPPESWSHKGFLKEVVDEFTQLSYFQILPVDLIDDYEKYEQSRQKNPSFMDGLLRGLSTAKFSNKASFTQFIFFCVSRLAYSMAMLLQPYVYMHIHQWTHRW